MIETLDLTAIRERVIPLDFKRALVAVLVGLLAFFLSLSLLAFYDIEGGDFTWTWRAARHVLAGENPYSLIQPEGNYPYNDKFYYPLPAAVLAIPFAALPVNLAGALFYGLSSAALAYAAVNERKYWAVFLSAPYFIAAGVAQWGMLMLAAAAMPRILGGLFFLKPTLGAISFSYRPTRRALLVAAALCILTLAIAPTWPLDWLRTSLTPSERYMVPALTIPGAFLLLALIAWRKPEGRALFAAAVMPRNPYWYDGLMLWLIPRTLQHGLILSLLSWGAYFGWKLTRSDPGIPSLQLALLWQIALMYLPALILVIRYRKD